MKAFVHWLFAGLGVLLPDIGKKTRAS